MKSSQTQKGTNQDSTKESEEEKSKEQKNTDKSSKLKEPKRKEKEIYFIILYQRNEKENPTDMVFSKDCDNSPTIILNNEIKIRENIYKYIYQKVFKYKNIGGKKNIELIFFLGENVDKYIIQFEIKHEIFIYDVDLEKGNKYLDNIARENIDQKMIDYQDKLDLFLKALKENKEENKIEQLYIETIKLYSKKKNFSLLISLFSRIHQDKKLCELLLGKFYNMEKDINPVRDEKLGDHFNSLMAITVSEAENLIKENGYNPIQFYGLLLCYLNFYDYQTLKIVLIN